MEWVVGQVLVGILWLFLTTEEFLLAGLKILTNSKGSSREDNLIISLSEVQTVLVSVTCESINVVNLECNIWLRCVELISIRWLLIDHLQKGLVALFLLRYFFIHPVVFF